MKKPDPVPKTEYSRVVPAVEQAACLLLALAGQAPSRMNLTDLCRRVDIHKSKGFAILNTLQTFGFVQRDEREGKRYGLGPGLISLGRAVLDNLNFKEVADPVLATLARETGSPALFGLITGQNVFVIAKNEGRRFRPDHPSGTALSPQPRISWKSDRGLSPGKTRTAAALQPGKALLPRRSLAPGPPSSERELARCRRKGYAEDPGEMTPQIQALAAPVFGAAGRLVGVLFVTGLISKNRMKPYGRKVAERARQMSRLLGAEVEGAYGERSG